MPEENTSIEKLQNLIRDAWREINPFTPVEVEQDSWIVETYEDHIIVNVGGDYFLIPYTKDGEEITFSDKTDWIQVEEDKEWVAVIKALKARSNALKFVSETDNDLRVANHIILFGGRDLEGIMSPSVNPDGSLGEYFTKDTDIESEATKAGQLEVDWEHGQQPEDEGPGPRDILGYVDWKTAKWTDLGVWVERVLDRRNKYVKYLEKLIKKGLIGNSSEADPDGIERDEDGKIAKWPLKRDTLTVSPMEPRMLTENVISALKALELNELLPDAELKPSDGLDDEAEVEEDENLSNKSKGKEPNKMTEKVKEKEEGEEEVKEPTPAPVIDMDAITKQVTEAAKAAVAEAVKEMWDAEVTNPKGLLHPPNLMKHANLGDPDPSEDFYNWVRTGKGKIKEHTVKAELPDGRGGTYKAALQEGATDEGGYLVPAGELGRIIEKRDEVALLPKVGASQFTTDRDVFNIPTEGTALTKFTIVAEEGAISGAENEPTFGQADITLYNFKKLIKVSEELLEDYNSGLDAFLTSALGRAWGITDNYYVQIGTGTAQPQGVFVGGTAALTLDSASAIGVTEVPELMGYLKMAYRPGAVIIMARETIAYLRGLTGNQFQFAAPPASAITVGGEDLNLGYPVFGTEDAATITTSAKSMLFGNFALFAWVRNRSLRVRRLVELYAGNGQVGILANYRAGSEVLQAEAFQYATHPTA